MHGIVIALLEVKIHIREFTYSQDRGGTNE